MITLCLNAHAQIKFLQQILTLFNFEMCTCAALVLFLFMQCSACRKANKKKKPQPILPWPHIGIYVGTISRLEVLDQQHRSLPLKMIKQQNKGLFSLCRSTRGRDGTLSQVFPDNRRSIETWISGRFYHCFIQRFVQVVVQWELSCSK